MATRAQGQNGPSQRKIRQLVLLGDFAVGKSSLVLQLVKSQYQEYQESTVGGKQEGITTTRRDST